MSARDEHKQPRLLDGNGSVASSIDLFLPAPGNQDETKVNVSQAPRRSRSRTSSRSQQSSIAEERRTTPSSHSTNEYVDGFELSEPSSPAHSSTIPIPVPLSLPPPIAQLPSTQAFVQLVPSLLASLSSSNVGSPPINHVPAANDRILVPDSDSDDDDSSDAKDTVRDRETQSTNDFQSVSDKEPLFVPSLANMAKQVRPSSLLEDVSIDLTDQQREYVSVIQAAARKAGHNVSRFLQSPSLSNSNLTSTKRRRFNDMTSLERDHQEFLDVLEPVLTDVGYSTISSLLSRIRDLAGHDAMAAKLPIDKLFCHVRYRAQVTNFLHLIMVYESEAVGDGLRIPRTKHQLQAASAAIEAVQQWFFTVQA